MKLTRDERKWLRDVQRVLDACPSDRLGFYTIGDPQVTVYNRTKEEKINALMDAHDKMDFPQAVQDAKADLHINLDFPACVHSVAG
jgi:hypothetical protein